MDPGGITIITGAAVRFKIIIIIIVFTVALIFTVCVIIIDKRHLLNLVESLNGSRCHGEGA